MNMDSAAIYRGEVVHERLRPRHHKLRYRVFSLLVDLDHIAELGQRFRLFSHNRFNLFSFHDRDHGPGDGQDLAAHIRALLTQAGLSECRARILLLSYPRMLGYVFNPLSVYFCLDGAGRLGAIAYEVSNTFHERKTYLLAADRTDGRSLYQKCAKSFYVSPFNTARGTYSFHIQPPDERVGIGVALRDEQGPLMRAHFAGMHEPLNDATLARLALRYPLMTLKVIGGIHLEAFRLWWKGVPLVRRPAAPGYSVDFVPATASRAEPLVLDNAARPS
ncbi:DUF1365 domain-containing protein [Dichotomicrobium thermohalophilum]|uniref:DUF1365 family protein n=1 Tax=Dichotomicrobium thermohalophilum TaxID=933063 RepID=A0A397QAR5_9HYPH|nr:DUF1365 domain-containing protein [Dichotomicrobium thermohalophilum]RIA56577.1 hypothetical protein BXY53_1683 [Dichotomicrobium thermohalophilum]